MSASQMGLFDSSLIFGMAMSPELGTSHDSVGPRSARLLYMVGGWLLL